jgi:uncharacterized protein
MPTLQQAEKWYQESDGVHDFDHIRRVYAMASRLAREEGADLEIVQAAALLHDVADSAAGTPERENHHIASAEFAAAALVEEGWPPERITAVQHCIRAHRFRARDERPETLEAQILFDADKLDVLGAIGVARTIAYSIKVGQQIYAPPSAQFLQTGKEEPGEPHTAYHEHLFKLSKIKDLLFTATARRIAEERSQYLDDYFKRLIAETKGEQ